MFEWPSMRKFNSARSTDPPGGNDMMISFPPPVILNSPPPKANPKDQPKDYWLQEPSLTITIQPATPTPSPRERQGYFANANGAVPITPPTTPGLRPTPPRLMGNAHAQEGQKKAGEGEAGGKNYWLYHEHPTPVFDLTRPPLPTPIRTELPLIPPRSPHIALTTTTAPILIDPHTTALIIVDVHNANLVASPLGPGVQTPSMASMAMSTIRSTAVPAARKAGISVAWLGFGVDETDATTLVGPGTRMAFEWHERGIRTERDISIGQEVGAFETSVLDTEGRSTGEMQHVKGGKRGVKGSWDTELFEPLQRCFQESQLPNSGIRVPDRRFWRDRFTGLGDELAKTLQDEGITTLLFAGLWSETAVLGAVHDAAVQGFDTVLLRDGCASMFNDEGQNVVERMCSGVLGFASACDWLEKGVEEMLGWPGFDVHGLS